MHYIIQILAAILIGTAVGTLFGPRNTVLLIGTVVAIALGIATLVTISWLPLAIGAVVFVLAHAMQRDKVPTA